MGLHEFDSSVWRIPCSEKTKSLGVFVEPLLEKQDNYDLISINGLPRVRIPRLALLNFFLTKQLFAACLVGLGWNFSISQSWYSARSFLLKTFSVTKADPWSKSLPHALARSEYNKKKYLARPKPTERRRYICKVFLLADKQFLQI